MYLTIRTKAELFLKYKTVKKQQKNLSVLLGTLPDSVLICTNETDEKQSIGVYANPMLNSFFGCDVI